MCRHRHGTWRPLANSSGRCEVDSFEGEIIIPLSPSRLPIEGACGIADQTLDVINAHPHHRLVPKAAEFQQGGSQRHWDAPRPPASD